ncbi:MAG: LamG-like jellyroll fold domain-containing protein, partial [Leadbetterella sp.]
VANFVNTNTSNLPTNFQNVLLSTKKTSFSLPDMQGWENSTSEAWVYPNANTHISTSYSNEGEIQRVLFKSTGSSTNLDWWLSVGSNGATLYEKNNDPTLWKHTRIALSYEVELKGWNHIAVSYLNNLPHLYINGELVAKAKETGKDYFRLESNYVARAPNVIGQEGKSFEGYMDEVKFYNAFREESKIKQSMLTRADNTVSTDPNLQKYYTFNTPSEYNTSGTLQNGSVFNSTNNSKIGNMPEFSFPQWYYNGELVADSSYRYVVPKEQLKIGSYTYVFKYKGKNNTDCEATKKFVVVPPPINDLSGCYYLKAQAEASNSQGSSSFFGTISGLEVNNPNISVQNGFDDIWKVSHVGNEEYELVSTYNVGYNLTSKDIVSLRPNINKDIDHVWKLVPSDSSAMIYSIRTLSDTTNCIGFYSPYPSELNIQVFSNQDYQKFKLEKTACPQPPLACVVDAKINYERWFRNLNGDATFYNNLDVNQYLAQNKLADYSEVISLPNVSITDATDATGVFTDKPANWRNEKFISRISGYICPPQSGKYHLAIKTNQWAQLYISTDEDPAKKVLKVTATSSSEFPDNTAYGISLVKGRNYYFEIIGKDQDNYHSLAFAFKLSAGGNFNSTDEPASLTHISSFPRDYKKRKRRSRSGDCGQPEAIFTGVNPLTNLWPKDTVFAGDFVVEIENVKGDNGIFSGYGVSYMNNKWWKDTRIVVKFNGIGVNDEYELTSGFFESTYDKTKKNIKDVSDEFHKFRSFIEAVDSMATLAWNNIGNRRKLNHLIKSIKEMAEQDLPSELQIEANEIADRISNATNKVDYDQAVEDLKALKAKKDRFLDWYVIVAKQALQNILATSNCVPTSGQKYSAGLESKEGFEKVDDATISDDPSDLARFTTQINYNSCVIAKSFATVFLGSNISNDDISSLAKELTKGGQPVIDELYTIYKGALPSLPPASSTAPSVVMFQSFLMSNVNRILADQVYNGND